MPYQTLTLADLRTQLADKWESVPYWTTEDARLALNESLRVWNLLTGYWKRRVTIATTGDAVFYALPASMVFRMRVEWNQSPLGHSSLFDLDYGRPRWQAESTGDGGDVPVSPSLWAPVSLMQIAIWPRDAAGGNALVVDGVSATPALVLDTDFVDLNEALTNVLLGYALHVAAFKEGWPRFSSTLPYYRDFLLAAVEENDQLKSLAFYRRYMGLDTNLAARPMHGAAVKRIDPATAATPAESTVEK